MLLKDIKIFNFSCCYFKFVDLPVISGGDNDQLVFNRWKRDVFGSISRKKDKYVTEPIGFDRRGGLHHIFGEAKIKTIL